ncbi:XRE family transcriptional regulator [Melissococcus plutonius]|uniref:XRE family transcriptional regulator n=1 Tax=Melissococcus plutonius TaxID=33970 RepID=UPI0021E587F9|nr:XRE family transcriptional regulator [Melissococcus plutonius]MCV2498225.1 XRE family transcriptional regulator [Melissococcus plutonius]MCV2501959.1 XRE family transcriptional regulator [Melissococcus plutonius]MCV2506840.1 XRE family transcriptional regulator [Melissococcus plutonius]MCV2528070.1 XRE family transcriptional regulator [Melissococcus plutonius]
MIVDTDKIKWLLENRTQYFISKKTKISQSKLSNLKSNKIDIENLTIRIGSELTKLAQSEQDTTI